MVVIYPQGDLVRAGDARGRPPDRRPDDRRRRDPRRPADRRRLPEQPRLPAPRPERREMPADAVRTCDTIAEVRARGRRGPAPGAGRRPGADDGGPARRPPPADRGGPGRRRASSSSRSSSTRPSSGPTEDFRRYPRTLDADLALCERGRGRPGLRPDGRRRCTRAGRRSTFVEVPALSDVLEGASRPGPLPGRGDGRPQAVRDRRARPRLLRRRRITSSTW